ncbi:hypothetical protein FA341_14895 [Pseudomonas aeruginosa]|nr:hypothetical protein [Pseudomonas aeruginosa]
MQMFDVDLFSSAGVQELPANVDSRTEKTLAEKIAKEGGEYDWLKPLNDLRNYIKARHFDPSARCWLARKVDMETGTVKIAPNAYSPAFTKELLGIMLTIQLDEFEAAQKAGIKPRFMLLDIQQLLAVEALWGRYGYQKPFTAMRVFLEVYEQGVRYEVPDISALPKYTEADLRYPEVEVPFCDDQYQGMFNGLRSISHAAADAEFLTTTRNCGMQIKFHPNGDDLLGWLGSSLPDLYLKSHPNASQRPSNGRKTPEPCE